ncbi:MAG TPA: DMT family transporter [Candidatus Angelobacter sp.]|nr:DMT family transporter [Candidatus Angelobacter sp.]
MPKVPRFEDRSLKAHILLVLMTLIWGTSFVLVKEALRSASPLLFNAVRMTLAATLLALIYRKQLSRLTRPAMRAGVVVGVFMFLGYAFQTTGLHLTTPSKSAFLTGVSTVLVPLLLIILWRAHINPWRAAGILTAFAGLFFMTVPPGRQGMADFANINLGDVLTIACALGFAFQIIFIGRATQRFPFEQIAVLQIAVSAVLMAISAPFLEHLHMQLSSTVVTAILVTGILGTALAFTVQAWAQQFTPATHAALIFTLEPVFAWLTSFVVLKERLGVRAGAGALLIVAGVLVSEMLGNVSRPEQALVEG